MYQFIKPFGIITYSLIIVTILSGLFGLKLKYHKLLAVLTLIVATAHGLIVLISD